MASGVNEPEEDDDAMVTLGEHREAAENALIRAQRNRVMSAGESFLAGQVHALLAIEQRLGELGDEQRPPTRRYVTRSADVAVS